MTEIQGEYTGDLQCSLEHRHSGTIIYTDAPADIQGKARTFSPTDLLAAALGSCIATTIALYAERKKINVNGMRFDVTKEMSGAPERRIERLKVNLLMPHALPSDQKQSIERVANACPVHKSLHPGVEVVIHFHWPS